MTRNRFVLIAGLVGLLALALGFLTPHAWRHAAYIHASVPLAVLGLLAMLVATLRLAAGTAEQQRSRMLDAGVALLLTVLIAMVVPGRALIENDEANMLMTANGINNTLTPVAPMAGVFQADGALAPMQVMLDKRGVMFPVMIAVFNGVLGANVQHALWVSLIGTLGALFFALRLARRVLSPVAALAVPILLASFPVFSVHARTGTFDVMSFACFLLTLQLLLSYLSNLARAADGKLLQRYLWALIASAGVLAQLRYEQVGMAGLAIAVVLLVLSWRPVRDQDRGYLAALAPLLLLPATLRMAIEYGHQLPVATAVPWAVKNFVVNAERLVFFTVWDAKTQSGNSVIGVLALIGALGISVSAVRMLRAGRDDVRMLLWILLPFAILNALLLFYWWGQASNLITVRMFVPHVFALALVATFFVHELVRSKAILHWALPVLAIAALTYSLPKSRNPPLLTTIPLAVNRDVVVNSLRAQNAVCTTLILADNTIPLVARGINAMTKPALDQIGLDKIEQIAGRKLQVVDLQALGNLRRTDFDQRLANLPADVQCQRSAIQKIRNSPLRAPDPEWLVKR
jgi:hypothetical protein